MDLAKDLGQVLDEEKKRIQSVSHTPPPTTDQASAEALDQLPWKLYREGHLAGWVFAEKAPKALLDRLEREAKPIAIGEYRYRFSGPQESPKLFIARAPAKEEA